MGTLVFAAPGKCGQYQQLWVVVLQQAEHG